MRGLVQFCFLVRCHTSAGNTTSGNSYRLGTAQGPTARARSFFSGHTCYQLCSALPCLPKHGESLHRGNSPESRPPMTSMRKVSESSWRSSVLGSVRWRVRTARRVSRSAATPAAQMRASAAQRLRADGSCATIGGSCRSSWNCACPCTPTTALDVQLYSLQAFYGG